MHIAIPTIGLGNRGGDRVTIELANRLTHRGHRVVFAVPRGALTTTFAIHPRVEIRQFAFPIPQIEDLSSILRTFFLTFTIPKADILLANYYLTAFPIALAKKLKRCKTVAYLIQHYEPLAFGEHEKTFPKLKRWLGEQTYRYDFHQAAVAKWIARRVEQVGGHRVSVIRPGVDMSLFCPAPHPPDPNTILSFPGKDEWKGWQDFTTAVGILEKKRSDHVVIASSRQEYPLPPGPYRAVHPASDQELADIYRSAAVYVHSAWIEGCPLAPLESMACGTPVVAAASEGIREYAVDRENCLLVDPRSPEQLAAAIGEVLSNRDLAQRLRQGGLQTAARFTWERMADEFEEFLLSCLGGAAGR